MITMIEVLEHIPPEIIPDFLQAVADCLVPSGKLILTVPHTNKRVQEKHYQHFTSASLQKTLEPFFTVDRIIPFDRISTITGWMLRLLGYTSNNYLITNKRLNSFCLQAGVAGLLTRAEGRRLRPFDGRGEKECQSQVTLRDEERIRLLCFTIACVGNV